VGKHRKHDLWLFLSPELVIVREVEESPTWNKGVPKSMAAIWQRAHEILSTANQIRVIGYSLPVADAYIKYLLKSSVVSAPNLKAIDVICRDSNGATQVRYKEFVRFGYARFANTDVTRYFQAVRDRTIKPYSVVNNSPVRFSHLEVAHEEFFLNNGTSL
jgi:hypothetical protein